MKTVFLRALEDDDKATALKTAIMQSASTQGPQRFEVDPNSFAQVHGSPFSYWVSDQIRGLFKSHPPFEKNDRIVRQGGVTGNDARFLRVCWEIVARKSEMGLRWVPFAKGGNVSPWYADYPVVVAWDDRRETFFGYTGLLHRPSEKPSSADHYFRAGLTWPLRAARFGPVPLPRNSIFSIRGYAILAAENELLALGAIGNSTLFDYIFKVALGRFGFPEFVVGVLQKLPLPAISPDTSRELSAAVRRAWALKRNLDTRSEVSRAFVLPAVLQMRSDSIGTAAQAWAERIRAVEEELSQIQTQIDARCFELYGIDEDDRRSITEGFGGGLVHTDGPFDAGVDAEEEPDEDVDAPSGTDAETLAADLISWAVGVAFGRFDLCLATGARPIPKEPEPFDSQPVCSPGILAGDDGRPLMRAPAGYPLAFPEDGILVDDPGQATDLTAAVRRVFDEVFNESADAYWNEATALLDPQGEDLRAWLASNFFPLHLKRHSKSRRKAPILWQLTVTSGRYSIWLYAHRITRDTFFQLQNDVVTPKLAHEERQLTSLMQSAGSNPSAKERKEIAAQESFVEELRFFLDEVKRVAPLWKPTLDDGVVLTVAPLWRLMTHHKPWQKELKSKWEELAGGKYDWAQLAMHLWPERVIPKCASDRSLAIAHGLEDIFWVEGDDGKWKTRSTPSHTVDELILERSSPAVKSALKMLLESPDSAPTSRRRRRGAEGEGGALS
jgi:hypothetical protein